MFYVSINESSGFFLNAVACDIYTHLLVTIPGYLLCTFTLHVYETMHFIKFYVHIFQKSISLVFP